MTFTTYKLTDDIGVVRIAGRLDFVSAGELREAVHALLSMGRRRIALDVSMVDVMDSTGLGVVVSCWKAACSAGGDLRLCSLAPQVAMMLQLSNLARVLTTSDSVEDAYRV